MEPYELEQWHQTVNWEEYIEYAETNGYSWADIKWLKPMLRHNPSWKQIKAAQRVVEKIDAEQNRDSFSENFSPENENTETKHLTVRVAWHDNKWNGTICKDPENNIYCNGYNSLLSERLRRRKKAKLESKEEYAGQPFSKIIKDENYIPPCFWSINAFGENACEIEHDNPAEPKLTPLKEKLPNHSVFSWPFAVSFNRDLKVESIEGAYPPNLEPNRIPHFQNKLKENESIVFLYANYDNPVSGEDQEYLVVGVGLLKEKGEATRFNGQDEIIENKKKLKHPNNKNFPRINWALRYTLDWPNNVVRIPYHEFLQKAEKDNNYDILDDIKVSISEPELIHNFKYVAMDIDDDACIYILTKIRQKLYNIVDSGIIPPEQIKADIKKVDDFLAMAWDKRGYLPGLNNLVKELLPHLKDKIDFKPLIEEVLQFEDDPVDAFLQLLDNPESNTEAEKYTTILEEIKAEIIDSKGITLVEFVRLSMLNLSSFQFGRILRGHIPEDGYISLNKVCNNPYLLFEEYVASDEIDPNLGDQLDFPIDLFKIDIAYFPNTRYLGKVNLQKEFNNTDKRRVRALIMRYLRNLESFGHCFDEAKNIEEALTKYPLFYRIEESYNLPEDFLYKIDDTYEAHLNEQLEIVCEKNKKYFYLNELYNAEQLVSNKIKEILSKEILEDVFKDFDEYLSNSVKELSEDITDFEQDLFIEERTRLYHNIFKQRIFVLSGSPGSGKSHELLNIISTLKSRGESYLLLAPTGKAALRLSSDKKFEDISSMTIDKYLHLYKHKINVQEKEYQNLIVDEMSMVDLLKFQKLLRIFNFNNPSFKRLILVGDQFQLPPIGFGKVFIDIIEHLKTNEDYKNSYIQLETNCRQSLDSEILNFSRLYSNVKIGFDELSNNVAKGGKVSEKGGFIVKYWQNEDELTNAISQRINEIGGDSSDINSCLNQLIGLKPDGKLSSNNEPFNIDGFQILSPYRTGKGGSGKINTHFQSEIRKDKFLEANKLSFKHTDKVIQNKNVYRDKELALSNGTIGLAYDNNKKYSIIFPEYDNYKPIGFYDSLLKQENIELAYCITVHKSQGSGFDHVFVIIPERLSLLSKELFYTALTRSRKTLTLFVQGEPVEDFSESIFEIIRNRSYTEIRKTSVLSLPFWDYSLEPEKGVFVQSRVEYIIYKQLLQAKEKNSGFEFFYEKKPVINGTQLKMKTDFTLVTPEGKTLYWEHLGMLGNAYYERKWAFKRTKYQEYKIEPMLITTDERHGIFEDKIELIINLLIEGKIETEDKHNNYSLHHYYLR